MVYVIGEALIDLVMAPAGGPGPTGYLAHPGGSPYNVAIGLARLGQPARLLARLSGDAFGRQLRAHAEANGVDLSCAVDAAEQSTLAVVSLDAERNAEYDFYRTGTADWQWSDAELDRIPADASWLHTGSLASWTEPGAGVIAGQLRRRRQRQPVVVSYDPNIRPALLPDHRQALDRVEAMVRLADVVKASAEDLAWLYPGRGADEVLRHWRGLGTAVVVMTDGGRGARFLAGQSAADGEVATVPGRPVEVVDTVGAGDAFMAGLINALVAGGFAPGAGSAVAPAVAEAVLVAALTCARAGANPPTAAELAAARDQRD
ncbi:carbohydrate kinase family protein [Jatrophihabitans sp.]|uniref:carbohydrate kinase family protein n=1 Tax=Jatrophihabitans sp. TaxID=1932789 RepID=UPI002C871056|nr:carbohydrate kinase [Jatrophihabitans sp.]